MEPSIGIEGIFNFEFIRHFAHERPALLKVTISRQIRNPQDFVPIHLNRTAQSNDRQFARASQRRRIFSRISGYQYAFDQQIFRLHHQHFSERTFHPAEGCARKTFRRAEQIKIHPGDLPVARAAFRTEQAHDFLTLACGQCGGRGVAHVQVAGSVCALRQNLDGRAATTTSCTPRSAQSALQSDASLRLFTVGSCSAVMSANALRIFLASMNENRFHSTVTLLARLRGLSTSQPRATAM